MEEQNKRSYKSSIGECVRPVLTPRRPSSLVSSLVFKLKHSRTHLCEWEAAQGLLRAKLEASTSLL